MVQDRSDGHDLLVDDDVSALDRPVRRPCRRGWLPCELTARRREQNPQPYPYSCRDRDPRGGKQGHQRSRTATGPPIIDAHQAFLRSDPPVSSRFAPRYIPLRGRIRIRVVCLRLMLMDRHQSDIFDCPIGLDILEQRPKRGWGAGRARHYW